MLFITISDFSIDAKILYSTPTGENLSFDYNCSSTEGMTGDTEVVCYPIYNTIQTFFAPQNQDAATILCRKTNGYFQLAIGYAIPCNGIPECDNGSDEFGCKFPKWLIPSLLCGAGAVLCITLFVYLDKSIKIRWKKKMRFQFRSSHISIESEKLYRIAVLIENGDVEKIHQMYCQEVENNGGEGGALCYFKVMKHLIKSLGLHP